MSDPAQYRSRDEVKEIRDQSDPIENFKNKIIKKKYLSSDEINKINTDTKNIVDAAADFSSKSKLPPVEELYNDIYR